MAETMAYRGSLDMDPGTQGRSHGASSPTLAEWRVKPTPALLLPPGAGMTAASVLETTPGVFAGRVRCDRWLGELAARVRAGEVSPEQALLAACIYGETRRPEPPESASVVGLVRP